MCLGIDLLWGDRAWLEASSLDCGLREAGWIPDERIDTSCTETILLKWFEKK